MLGSGEVDGAASPGLTTHSQKRDGFGQETNCKTGWLRVCTESTQGATRLVSGLGTDGMVGGHSELCHTRFRVRNKVMSSENACMDGTRKGGNGPTLKKGITNPKSHSQNGWG